MGTEQTPAVLVNIPSVPHSDVYPRQYEFYQKLEAAIREKTADNVPRLAGRIYENMKGEGNNVTFHKFVEDGKTPTPCKTRKDAVTEIAKRIRNGVLSGNVEEDDFVFPFGLKATNDSRFEDAVRTAKSIYQMYADGEVDPLAHQTLSVEDTDDLIPDGWDGWREASRPEKAEYLARRIIAPKYKESRLLEHDMNHYRPMNPVDFIDFCCYRIRQEEMEMLNDFKNHVEHSFEIGICTLFKFHKSVDTDQMAKVRVAGNCVLVLSMLAQLFVPIWAFIDAVQHYRYFGKGFCERDAGLFVHFGAAFVAMLYSVLAFYRILSTFGEPSAVFISSSDEARFWMNCDRFWFFFYKSLIPILYIVVLSTDPTVKSMVINSGALEFWLEFDVRIKNVYLRAFPLDVELMYASTKRSNTPSDPTKESAWYWLRVITAFTTLASFSLLPICKSNFFD